MLGLHLSVVIFPSHPVVLVNARFCILLPGDRRGGDVHTQACVINIIEAWNVCFLCPFKKVFLRLTLYPLQDGNGSTQRAA